MHLKRAYTTHSWRARNNNNIRILSPNYTNNKLVEFFFFKYQCLTSLFAYQTAFPPPGRYTQTYVHVYSLTHASKVQPLRTYVHETSMHTYIHTHTQLFLSACINLPCKPACTHIYVYVQNYGCVVLIITLNVAHVRYVACRILRHYQSLLVTKLESLRFLYPAIVAAFGCCLCCCCCNCHCFVLFLHCFCFFFPRNYGFQFEFRVDGRVFFVPSLSRCVVVSMLRLIVFLCDCCCYSVVTCHCMHLCFTDCCCNSTLQPA